MAGSLAEGLDDLSGRAGEQVGVDETVEVAVEHALGVADLEIRAVILDELVWVEDIAADRVAAEAHADDAPFLRELLLTFLLGQLGQAGLEDPEGGLLVRSLRALVLALDDDAGREMSDPDGRVGLVDVLAAGALGAVGIDAEVVLVDLDVAV